MSIKIETSLTSQVDQLELSVLMVLPADFEQVRCKAVIQIVHGMSEYKERYLPFMEYMAQHGIASVIHDHRGHGKSIRSSLDLGYMYGVGITGFMKDLLLVNQWAKKQLPDVPLVMLGHSMGSLAARVFLRKQDQRISALILTGPPSQNTAAGLGLMLANMQKKLKGAKSPGKALETMAFGNYVVPFKDEKSRYAWINSDKDKVKEYEEDPLCGFTFTADGFQVLLQLLKTTYVKSGWNCSNSELPILFLGGEQDPCIGSEKKFCEEVQFLQNAGYKKVTGKRYPNMRHEILNEPEHLLVFDDILDFLKAEVVSE